MTEKIIDLTNKKTDEIIEIIGNIAKDIIKQVKNEK